MPGWDRKSDGVDLTMHPLFFDSFEFFEHAEHIFTQRYHQLQLSGLMTEGAIESCV